jgi:hypothetical protein
MILFLRSSSKNSGAFKYCKAMLKPIIFIITISVKKKKTASNKPRGSNKKLRKLKYSVRTLCNTVKYIVPIRNHPQYKHKYAKFIKK